MTLPSGILTFCTGGKPHLQIEREFWEMLERERRKAVKEAQRNLADRQPSKMEE